jgi:hypothetical protein
MRAREFVIEQNGQLGQRRQAATRGLNIFSDGERWNTDYTLNRVMMAVASTDGTFVPDMDEKSWVGKSKTAHPYTKQEQDMLKMAYQSRRGRCTQTSTRATWTVKNIQQYNHKVLSKRLGATDAST